MAAPKRIFAKHETFHIRDGWLNKGLDAVVENNRIFWEEDAPETLGIGKNMVRSLRFWLQAAGLTAERRDGSQNIQELTPLGEYIREYDPYQELDGTLWLIHHQLISNDELTTTWYWFFNHFVPNKFTLREFMERLEAWVNTQIVDKKVARNSLRRDFDCLLKTYLPGRRDASPEDTLESPLTALELLSSYVDFDDETNKRVKVYRFETGSPDNIHPLVMLYVLLKSQEEERGNASQVGLQLALREPRNVGRTFNIKPTDFEDILSTLNDSYPDWRVLLTRTGGLDQLTLPNVPLDEVLKTYYKEQIDASEEVQTWSRPLIK